MMPTRSQRAGCLAWLVVHLLADSIFAGDARAPSPVAPTSQPAERNVGSRVNPSSAPAAGGLKDDVSSQLSEADERYRRAVELYDDGDYDAALHELERVYTLAPMFRVLYNLGIVCLALRDYARAMTFFERYLEEGGAAIGPDVRADVTDQLRSLSERVAFVTIEVNVAGAQVTIDDRVVGVSPMPARVRVNAGSRRISAQAPNRLPESRVVGLAGGDETIVALTLPDLTQRPSSTVESDRPFPWLAWVSTAAFAGAAALCAVRAIGLQERYDRERGEVGVTRAELDAIDRQAFAFSIAADSLVLASLAGAGYSLYLTLWSKPAPAAPSERSPPDRLSLDLGLGHARLTGSF
jgi:hypothetical protein